MYNPQLEIALFTYITWIWQQRKRGKLSTRYVGPFKIIDRVGEIAYKLDLTAELEGIHSIFHVSHLRKCLDYDTYPVPLKDIEVDEQLNYIEQPVEIADKKEKHLRRKIIPLVKVIWKHRKESYYTLEVEEEMRNLYPSLFNDS
ncbi:uncharacterized protein LOC143598087 [Bidens hawaiensis]|uniref:uncharacterized protein LOC143598087 n=1 Tax=Bidens hawaiensis TaxID=980011 RepID=UPI004048EFEF